MIKTAKIRNGYVRGSAAADPRIISFKGIPYAQSPTGKIAGVLPDSVKTGMESESVLNFHQSVCRAFQDWIRKTFIQKSGM